MGIIGSYLRCKFKKNAHFLISGMGSLPNLGEVLLYMWKWTVWPKHINHNSIIAAAGGRENTLGKRRLVHKQMI